MKTAVIVSGLAREINLAIPTWDINGDFFLFVQDTYQDARRFDEQHKIIKDIEPFSDKFKGICIVDRITAPDTAQTTLYNQTWKWSVAYNFLQPYINKEGYDRFIIIRPDSYLRIYRDLDQLEILANTCHSTSLILSNADGLKFTNDTWMAFDLKVFEIVSNFYNYIASNNILGNIHSLLATYFELHNVAVNDDLLSFGESFQLRKEVRYMFDNNLLKDKYSYNDVAKELIEWNKQSQSTYQND